MASAIYAVEAPLLFKLRAAVGRFGEMDAAGWWNTNGVLGPRGAAVYKRGLARTHFFARVRVVKAVAAERSRSIYPAPGAATLWNLPPALERSLAFEERSWAMGEQHDHWAAFEASILTPPGEDLVEWLSELDLIDEYVADQARSRAVEPGGKGVRISGPICDESIRMLAAAHTHAASRSLVVPFIEAGLETNVE